MANPMYPTVTILSDNPRELETSVAWGVYCEVSYSKGVGSNLTINTPTYTGLVNYMETMSTSTETMKDWIIYLNPNLSPEPVTSSVVFSATTEYGTTEATYLIYHPASGSDNKPDNPHTRVFPTQSRVAWEGGSQKVTIDYVGVPEWTIQPLQGTGSLTVTSTSLGTNGWTSSYEYTFTAPTNNTTEARSWAVTASIRSGSYVRPGYFTFLQYPSQSDEPTPDPGYEFNPTIQVSTPIRVAWSDTRVTFPVTYVSGVNVNYVQDPTTVGITSITSNGYQDGANLVYEYQVTFPINDTEEVKARTINLRIRSGSVEATKQVVINQGAIVTGEPSVSAIPFEQTVVNAGGSADVEVEYKWSRGWTINQPQTDLTYRISEAFSSISGSYVRYNFTIPANHTQEYKHYYPTFSMVSGSETRDTYAAIHQWGQATTLPRITVYPTVTRIGASGGEAYTKVTYGGQPNWTIQEPVSTLSVRKEYQQSMDTRSVWNYYFTVPANSGDQRSYYATFSIASGSRVVQEPFQILQYAYESDLPRIEAQTPWYVGYDTTSLDIPVKFVGVEDSHQISYPINSGITSYTYDIEEESDGYLFTYHVVFPQNTSNLPVSRSMWVSCTTDDGNAGMDIWIYQGTSQSPSDPSVTASPYETPVAKEGGNPEIKVEYVTPLGWTVQDVTWEGELYPTILSALDTPSGSIWIYRFSVPANSTDQVKHFYPTFSIASGSDSRTANVVFTQAAGEGQVFNPSINSLNYVNVGWNTTNYILRVFYQNVWEFSRVKTPTLNGISSYTAVSWSENNNLVYDYTLTYPTNPTTSPVTRSITLVAEEGSVRAEKTVEIRQARSGSATRRSVTLNYYSKTLAYDETSVDVVATYKGFTSVANVSTPYTNMAGWSALLLDSTVVGNDLNVLWRLQGTQNSDTTPKTWNVFFEAGNLVPAQLTLTQNPEPQPLPTVSSSFLAWQDTNTDIGAGPYKVEVKSLLSKYNPTGDSVFYSEYLYPAPGEDTIKVNFNRVAEGLMEPVRIWPFTELSQKEKEELYDPESTQITKTWDQDGTTNMYSRIYNQTSTYRNLEQVLTIAPAFIFSTTLDGEEGLKDNIYTILDDWTWDKDNNSLTSELFGYTPVGNTGLFHVLSKYPTRNVFRNQYIPCSTLTTNGYAPNIYYNINSVNWANQLSTGLDNSVAIGEEAFSQMSFQYYHRWVRPNLVEEDVIDPCTTVRVRVNLPDNAGRKVLFEGQNLKDGDYVIYYYNTLGGYDYLLVKGPVVPYTSNTQETFRNYNRKTRPYQTNQLRKYTVNMGTMPDEESVFVEEMVTSPVVYLHDLRKDEIVEVRPTTSDILKKTFRNQGRQFANYEITLEEVNNYLRR